MPIDRRSRRERQCERLRITVDEREAQRARIELAEDRLEFLSVCFDLLDAIDAYNTEVATPVRSADGPPGSVRATTLRLSSSPRVPIEAEPDPTSTALTDE